MLRLLHKLLGKETYWHHASREAVRKKLLEMLDSDIKRYGNIAKVLPDDKYADLVEKAIAVAQAFNAYEQTFKACGDELIRQTFPSDFQSDLD